MDVYQDRNRHALRIEMAIGTTLRNSNGTKNRKLLLILNIIIVLHFLNEQEIA